VMVEYLHMSSLSKAIPERSNPAKSLKSLENLQKNSKPRIQPGVCPFARKELVP
jgi:hypothetical protein